MRERRNRVWRHNMLYTYLCKNAWRTIPSEWQRLYCAKFMVYCREKRRKLDDKKEEKSGSQRSAHSKCKILYYIVIRGGIIIFRKFIAIVIILHRYSLYCGERVIVTKYVQFLNVLIFFFLLFMHLFLRGILLLPIDIHIYLFFISGLKECWAHVLTY